MGGHESQEMRATSCPWQGCIAYSVHWPFVLPFRKMSATLSTTFHVE